MGVDYDRLDTRLRTLENGFPDLAKSVQLQTQTLQSELAKLRQDLAKREQPNAKRLRTLYALIAGLILLFISAAYLAYEDSAKLNRIDKMLGEYKAEIVSLTTRIDTLEADARKLKSGVLSQFITTKDSDTIDVENHRSNRIAAYCPTGFVAIGGACTGNPLHVVHPMTVFEPPGQQNGDRYGFACQYHVASPGPEPVGAKQPDPNNAAHPFRTLQAHVTCLKQSG